MINISILGGKSRHSGELIRILINHPDMETLSIYEPSWKGESVSQHHHGLIGEMPLQFSDRFTPSGSDVVFITEWNEEAEAMVSVGNKDLRIIDMTPRYRKDYASVGLAYGLSEINRKGLVRGQKRAILPSTVAAVALIALYPLAANLLLDQPLKLEVVGTVEEDTAESAEEIRSRLSDVQASFNAPVEVELTKAPGRGIRVRTVVRNSMAIEDVRRLYEEIYDDHNFTYLTSMPKELNEVEGTQKCLVSLRKISMDKVEIDAIADGTLRGGAGDAVHVMNLLCGLSEKTGLALKSSQF